jgi:FAD/FMN-containing dehydrogenase
MFDGLLPHGLYHYWKADFADNLTEPAIAEHVRYGPQIPTVNSAVHIYPLDGAVHDVAADQTAFAYRDVKFTHILAAVSPEPGPMPEYREWVRSYWSALHPHSAGGAYVNFLMDEGDERIASSYRGNYARLAAVKRKYDPGNLFRVNQNIRPAAKA